MVKGRDKQSVDRRALAKLRGCQDTTLLDGAACTNRCDLRKDCKIRRIKFLIQARNNKVRFEGTDRMDGVIVTVYTLEGTQIDEYIDERSGAVG